MTSAAEAGAGAGTPLSASLAAGLETLDLRDTVIFKRYQRVVLPADGFVFWVPADQLASGNALYNVLMPNLGALNTPPFVGLGSPPFTMSARGSIHITEQGSQGEDASNTVSTVVFTSEDPVDFLANVAPNTLWIGSRDGVRFAFSQRNMFYRQAALYHYRGQALNSQISGQVIDNPALLLSSLQVVSNSLPIWLAFGLPAPAFPSHLIPPNTPPPYIALHVEPSATQALQAAPLLLSDGSHWQLAHDLVRMTFYGLRNDDALDLQDAIYTRAQDDGCPYGVMNMPTVRDEKLGQVEMQVIAQKKTLSLEVSYYQQRARQIARQLIRQAFITITETQ